MSSTPAIISSAADLKAFLSSISSSNTLYIDLEGNNLSRRGTISLITILVYPEKVVRLLDVLTLQDRTFTVTSSSGGVTLKSIFEDPGIRKCFWDVRNDADALWALHRVGLAGVLDLQLLENATRAGDKTYVHGLGKCIQSNLKLGFMALNRWQRIKKDTRDRMATGLFAVRPLEDKTIQYCVNDVVHLPDLQDVYMKRMEGSGCLTKVGTASAARVAETRLPGYDPQASTKTHGPWGSGTAKKVLTLDETLDILEEQREEALAAEIFGDDDDMGYDHYDFEDDYPMNSADAAMDDTFDSCWDKGS